MSRFEEIINTGNSKLSRSWLLRYDRVGNRNNIIECRDGFLMSVVSGVGVYCLPKPALYDPPDNWFENVPADYDGPFTHVEVGFPSERPEPWECHHERDGCYGLGVDAPANEASGWKCYCESPETPTDTVYAYVPAQMVRLLIQLHGGEINYETDDD